MATRNLTASDTTRAAPRPAVRAPISKPIGALEKYWRHENGRAFAMADVTNPERALLRHFAEEADMVAPLGRYGLRGVVCWLLVPLTPEQLDLLAQFEADYREQDEPGEDSHDAEEDHHTPAGWAPDWRPDLFNADRVVPLRRRRAATAGGAA